MSRNNMGRGATSFVATLAVVCGSAGSYAMPTPLPLGSMCPASSSCRSVVTRQYLQPTGSNFCHAATARGLWATWHGGSDVGECAAYRWCAGSTADCKARPGRTCGTSSFEAYDLDAHLFPATTVKGGLPFSGPYPSVYDFIYTKRVAYPILVTWKSGAAHFVTVKGWNRATTGNYVLIWDSINGLSWENYTSMTTATSGYKYRVSASYRWN